MGFRFTAETLANELGVFGWVKNLSDGRVEVVAEAEESALEEFLGRISKYFSSSIQDRDLKWFEAGNEFQEFGIRF